ncbi:MAG: ATP-binding protein, partial [Phycisphaerales bacterium]
MAEVADVLADRYVCLFVDLQKCGSAADAIVELSLRIRPHTNLWQKASSVFDNVLSRVTGGVENVKMGDVAVTLRSGLTAGNWSAKGDHLLDILAGHE